ncbi:unnamed protein product [Ostreobium quekettii]|uniref:Uncharacterized protein n=1 Tax=Ostreobium quekettii TaxID=121088 RepID=A0A8S1JA62_9CHLO|nr:unnamed protein product [Ostreobium quekettii]
MVVLRYGGVGVEVAAEGGLWSVHPASVDSLTVNSAGIVVQHHFLESRKFRWGLRKKSLASEARGVQGSGRDIFSVGVSFHPPFSMFVNLKGQGDVQSGADASEALSLWGGWEARLAPTRGPRVVDVVFGPLGSAIKDLVLVDVGAGWGFSLWRPQQRRGTGGIAFEALASLLLALKQSLKANGLQDLVDVQPMLRAHRNETICVDHPLCALPKSAKFDKDSDQAADGADFRRGHGNRSIHGMMEGCWRVVLCGTLDLLLGEEMRMGALKVSTGSWGGWMSEVGLELIRRQMPNAIHQESNVCDACSWIH